MAVYMLVQHGMVQWIEHEGMKGMVWANDYDCIKHYADTRTDGAKVAEIGSVQGETIEGQLKASIKLGANGAFRVGKYGELSFRSFDE
jgi:hypothetical protein